MSDEPSSGFALRFISGKYQGGEYPLPSEREIVIGRGGELDIVLVEDMVSRKHAKITTQQGKIVIQDLGPTVLSSTARRSSGPASRRVIAC